MSEKSTVVLKPYSFQTDKVEEEVSVSNIARNITPEQMAYLLGEYCNYGMKDYRTGLALGKLLQSEHRTIQGSVIRLALGIIVGMADQKYTDARNETPVEMCKKIAEMVKNGDLEMGYMI